MTELTHSNALTTPSGEASLLQLAQEFGRDVERIEQFMLSEQQVECPVIHRYGPGVYIRELKIPAGTLAVGHHQNFEHTNIMLKGRVTMLHDDGSTTELVAPALFIGKPGRKIGYIHEDMVWLNVYATNEQIAEIIAHPGIRNRGTVCGSLAVGDPASELPALTTVPAPSLPTGIDWSSRAARKAAALPRCTSATSRV